MKCVRRVHAVWSNWRTVGSLLPMKTTLLSLFRRPVAKVINFEVSSIARARSTLDEWNGDDRFQRLMLKKDKSGSIVYASVQEPMPLIWSVSLLSTSRLLSFWLVGSLSLPYHHRNRSWLTHQQPLKLIQRPLIDVVLSRQTKSMSICDHHAVLLESFITNKHWKRWKKSYIV